MQERPVFAGAEEVNCEGCRLAVKLSGKRAAPGLISEKPEMAPKEQILIEERQRFLSGWNLSGSKTEKDNRQDLLFFSVFVF